MSIHIGKKIREIRDSEGLSRAEFAELTGIPAPTQKNYETERRDSVGSDILMKITNHPRFKKYTMWLMSEDGETCPEAGQISPALSPDGLDSTSSRRNAKRAG
ncbi:helix-turn-helix transcriptional regulator [Salmonella enterica]|nr:XRE family transcriptional regulator [Salmonella enterica subsp. diarizonae serovar 48:i:z]EEH1874091.1 helix-turn-helix transcriptional regulator [Salmonella enterica]EEM2740030.1 transcriptional regulator [Salmonella enterica]EEN5963274.1 transcriptional regulator [Salmonella enterica]EEO7833678.1 helix-turn-helix transcriptional regulator [Salmonella enterica]